MTGTISGVSGSGCGRDGFTHSVDGDLCVLFGEQVTISCEAKQSYSISGPNGVTAINDDLIITSYTTDNEGLYKCTTNTEKTIVVAKLRLTSQHGMYRLFKCYILTYLFYINSCACF